MHFEPQGILMRLIQGLQFKKHQPTGNGLDTVGTRLLSLPLVLLPKHIDIGRCCMMRVDSLQGRVWFTYIHFSFA